MQKLFIKIASFALIFFVGLSVANTAPHSIPGVSDEIYDRYYLLVDQATYNCPNVTNPDRVNVKLLWDLAKIENSFNPPAKMRGMLLAATCHESGYNPLAKGDRKFSKKRIAKAIGILQFWPWANKYIDRKDPRQSAEFWMKRIVRQLPSIKRQCKGWRFKNETRRWLAAWTKAVRAPKKGGRCYEKVKHYRLLKRWHRAIKKEYDCRGC
jgi:hypothetical protein